MQFCHYFGLWKDLWSVSCALEGDYPLTTDAELALYAHDLRLASAAAFDRLVVPKLGADMCGPAVREQFIEHASVPIRTPNFHASIPWIAALFAGLGVLAAALYVRGPSKPSQAAAS